MPAEDLEGDSIYLAPPPRIRLDTLRDESALRGGLSVRSAPGSPPSIHHHASWLPVGGDSIWIQWSTGHAGVMMRLQARDDSLRGYAEAWWDESSWPRHRAGVTARRVDCDTPLPPDHRSWRRFPRAVTLASGVTLPLDAALPEPPRPPPDCCG